MDARVGEGTVVDVELGGSLMPGGSRSGGERSDPERREPPTPPAGVVHLEGIERPDPEVPATTRTQPVHKQAPAVKRAAPRKAKALAAPAKKKEEARPEDVIPMDEDDFKDF